MQVTAHALSPLRAPKASLRDALRASHLTLRDGDIVAVSSKVVSIDEGRCVPVEGTDKESLVKAESDWYYRAPASRWRRLFTVARGALVGSAGIDESNGNGYFVLYPVDPFASARRLRKWFMREYGVRQLAVIVTDSTSIPMRRGAMGFALAWDGLDPLRDYRGTEDLFGREIRVEMANLVDGLAAAAVLEMGEGDECTPVAVIRGAKNIAFKNRARAADQLIVAPEDDLFAPLLWRKGWKRGER